MQNQLPAVHSQSKMPLDTNLRSVSALSLVSLFGVIPVPITKQLWYELAHSSLLDVVFQ